MKLVIPAIDIYEGKVVRLTKGDFSQQTVYSENPLEFVKFFVSKGFKRIHIVDLNAAKTGEIKILDLLRRIKNEYPETIIQFGGGVRSYNIALELLNVGVDFVVIGTMFVKNPEEFRRVVKDFRQRVILSLDVNSETVVIQGWQSQTNVSIKEGIEKALKTGVLRIMITDTTRDGTLLGPDINFIRSILDMVKSVYMSILIDEIVNTETFRNMLNQGVDIITRSINSFMDTLKSKYSGSYELRQKIEEYDKNINEYKESLKDSIPWEVLLRKYPKPLIIVSGGISSDVDIEEISEIDNGFLEGIVVGKSIYEGRISSFNR